MPTVCGWIAGLPRMAGDWLAERLEVWIEGGRGDWTTFREGASESGGRGRKIRMGMWRKGWVGGVRRMLVIRWKVGRSSFVCVSGDMRWIG